MTYYNGSNRNELKHWLCVEQVTGEEFLVCAGDYLEACRVAEEVGADFSCGCEREPEVYVAPNPITDEEAESLGLDEY